MGAPPRACGHRGDSRSPEGQRACRGLGHPKKDKAGLGLPLLTVSPSICGVWPRPKGFILQKKKINQAAGPKIALPPLGFYFATSLAPKMSLWARSCLPSPPVSGCLAPVTPVTAEKGDRSSAWVLERDPWAAWQDKCPASAGAAGQLPVQDGDRDGDGSAEDSGEAKASMPHLGNGGTGKAEPIPQLGAQRVPSRGTASPSTAQTSGMSSPG